MADFDFPHSEVFSALGDDITVKLLAGDVIVKGIATYSDKIQNTGGFDVTSERVDLLFLAAELPEFSQFQEFVHKTNTVVWTGLEFTNGVDRVLICRLSI